MNQQEGINVSLKISKTRISNRNTELKPNKSCGKPPQNIVISKLESTPKLLPKIGIQKLTSPKMGTIL